ncbi:MAG: hypothetical protein KAT48_04305 [Bacteroidales bacterium]|nr:hypothetical protein [Bacteroidales bacterium]
MRSTGKLSGVTPDRQRMESLIPPGIFNVNWDGTTSGGYKATKGTYVCRLMVDGEVSSRVKMVKMR